MDDEAKQLLREIRDTGLRTEGKIEKDMAFRRRVLIVALAALAIALGGMGYLLHTLGSVTAEEQRRAAASHQDEEMLPPAGDGGWKPKSSRPVNPSGDNPDGTP